MPRPRKKENRPLGSEGAQLRRLEAELCLSEERFSSVVENIGMGVAVIDREMRILTLNRQMRRWFPGVSTLLRPFCYKALPDPPGDDTCANCPVRQTFMDGEVHESVSQIPYAGEKRWFKVLASPLKDDRGRVTRAIEIFEDVTGVYRLQEALKASEQRYRAIIANSRNGVILFSAVDDGADFVITEFNGAAEKIEGRTKEEVVGRRVLDVFPGLQDMGLLDVLQQVWRTGRPVHHPASFYTDERISGWRQNFVYRIPSGEVVSIYTDETRRKQDEEKLRQRESELEAKSCHLEDVNAALRVLLEQRQNDRREIEKKVVSNFKELVLPYLQQLKTGNLVARDAALVDTITANLESIFSPFVLNVTCKTVELSPMELRVADLVRAGHTNQQIADLMGLSVNTILTHRFKVRKKLGLKNRKVNLRAYLRSME